jgi:P27 family predicted phage terminase small subunit
MKKSLRPPKSLSLEARAWWLRLHAEYDLDDEAARFLLEIALTAFDRMKQAQQAIAEHGLTVTDRWGQTKPNPAAQIQNS